MFIERLFEEEILIQDIYFKMTNGRIRKYILRTYFDLKIKIYINYEIYKLYNAKCFLIE
jgi:hypothetical protein